MKTFFKQQSDAKIRYSSGLLSFILYALSFLIGYDEESADHLLVLVKGILILASAVLYLLSCSQRSHERIRRQYSVLSLCILIYDLILFTATGQTILMIRDYPAILNSLVWTTVSIICIIRFRQDLIRCICDPLKNRDNAILLASSLIIAALVAAASAEPSGIMFTWDSDTLYTFIYSLGFESLYDAKLLTFHSHVSIVYSHFLVLFKLLFKDIRTGFFVLNTLCIIAASLGMTFLLKELIPGKKIISYILGNTMFMLSPWVLGLSTYHMYDYYIWCLFPMLILFMVRDNQIGFFVTGIMITFSKASGLAVFGSVCIGIVVTDIISQKKKSLPDVISDLRYWYYMSVAAVFFIFFKCGISAETQFEDTRFGIEPAHIFHQIKMFSSANFLWIFFIATIITVWLIFVSHRITIPEAARWSLLTLLIADLLFFLFNCLCITYRIPRYMDSHIAALYIFAAVLMISVAKPVLSYTLMVIVDAVMIISSFSMTDPVSKALFTRINVGDHDIVDFEMTDNGSFEDSMVCNREYYSYEALLDKALTYVISDSADGDEIMFSLGNDELTWGFSGGRYSYTLGDGKHYFEEFYDMKKRGLANGYAYEYYESDDMIPIDMHYIFPEESINDAVALSDSEVFYYLYMPTLNQGKESEISERFNVIREERFDFRGWQMNCIKFKL